MWRWGCLAKGPGFPYDPLVLNLEDPLIRELAPGVREVPGDGPTLAFLPGLQGDARVFSDFAGLTGQRCLLFDLPAGSPRRAGLLLAARVPGWLEGPTDWLTGSYGGLVLRSLPQDCVRTAAVVGTLPGPELIRRSTRFQARVLSGLPRPVVEVAYRGLLRRSLLADGVAPQLVARITRRGVPASVLLPRLQGVLQWDVAQPPRVPYTTVIGQDDPLSPWSETDVPGPLLRVPGGHRPWCSEPQALIRALGPLWLQGGPE